MPDMPDPTTAAPKVRRITLALYWGSLVLGFVLPWIMMVAADAFRRQVSLAKASARFMDAFHIRLFAPGESILFSALLGLAPFAVYAVFTLLHLGRSPRLGAAVVRRRLLGVGFAAVAMIAVSVWGHFAILTARGSTAAIGFIFLPFYTVIAMALGYGLGRLVARWRTG